MEDFLSAARKINSHPLFSDLRTFTTQPKENVFIVTNIYDVIDYVMSTQEKGLALLEEIVPSLMCAEDGSKTEP